ncbi:hypothetical protein EVAR_39490_1 [Eumeta japonica]|uniref:Uncharacterized protein n=1 Tax=Eumeta variegata TaxID=151549 RepID=A0A4C1W059_EUMVA|nr:hypothetical protein EVAR_39490_1 [Eumeta japonica]
MHWRGGVVIEREGMRERKERGEREGYYTLLACVYDCRASHLTVLFHGLFLRFYYHIFSVRSRSKIPISSKPAVSRPESKNYGKHIRYLKIFGTKFLTAGLEEIGILLRDRTEKNVVVKP